MLSATQRHALRRRRLWAVYGINAACVGPFNRTDHTPELGPLAIVWKLDRP